MAHRTPHSLNDNLRLARLTVPQWIAAGVAVVSLWACASLARGVHNPNLHILAVAAPTVLLVAPILAFGRGGIERYPAQVSRYAVRVMGRTMARGIAVARTQLTTRTAQARTAVQAQRRTHAPRTDARHSE